MEPEPDQYYHVKFFFGNNLFLDADPLFSLSVSLLSLVSLLVASALISGSEVAFFSLSSNDVITLKKEDSLVSRRILYLKDIPRKLLATILISNNFINIAIVILSDFILKKLLPSGTCEGWAVALFDYFDISSADEVFMGQIFHFSITILGVTFLLVLFGEVAPKVYARFNNIRLARVMASPLLFLVWVFSPVSRIMVGWTTTLEENIFEKAAGRVTTSREDIDEAIELTVQNEKGAKQEMDILKSIVKFGEVSVKQIMCSRVDVVAIEFDVSFDELLHTVRDSGFSRIPVYKTDFDNITGILYAKDLLQYIDMPDKFEWQSIMRTDVFYVPETKKINELLKEFQDRKQHMAIVVDEYGGCSGIVTLEDIMEEVIGDIKDEFDDEEEMDYIKLDEHNYIFEGKTLLNDLCRILDEDTFIFDEVRGDADSLAGLVLEMTGQIPEVDGELQILHFRLKILAANNRRIEKIKLTILPPEVEHDEV